MPSITPHRLKGPSPIRRLALATGITIAGTTGCMAPVNNMNQTTRQNLQDTRPPVNPATVRQDLQQQAGQPYQQPRLSLLGNGLVGAGIGISSLFVGTSAVVETAIGDRNYPVTRAGAKVPSEVAQKVWGQGVPAQGQPNQPCPPPVPTLSQMLHQPAVGTTALPAPDTTDADIARLEAMLQGAAQQLGNIGQKTIDQMNALRQQAADNNAAARAQLEEIERRRVADEGKINAAAAVKEDQARKLAEMQRRLQGGQ